MNDFRILQINHRNAVIAELSKEHPLPGQIDGEVVDASPHLAQGNLGLKLQRRRRCLRRRAARWNLLRHRPP